jgi:uncharacterized membrane protein
MSDLIVIAFDNESDGPEALATLRGVGHETDLRIDDSAVIVKDAQGKLQVRHQTDSTTKMGAVGGGALGLLIFMMFPVAGIAIGAAGGALVGHLLDRRVDPAFVKEVSESLTPGTSALFLLIREGDPRPLVAGLGRFRGKVLQTTLDPELEASLESELARQS